MPFDTDPLRLKILKGITDALKEITIANGYNFNLTNSVYRGRLWFGEGDSLPLVSILEMPVPLEPTESSPGATKPSQDWDLLIQGFAPDDRENPTDPAHFLMADVKKRLGLESKKLRQMDPTVFGLKHKVELITIGQGSVRPADDAQDAAYFWLRVTLKIYEDNANPYV